MHFKEISRQVCMDCQGLKVGQRNRKNCELLGSGLYVGYV